MDGRSYREQTQYDLLGNTCRKYGFGLFVQYGYSGRAGCGLNGVGGGGNTTSTQSAHQTASLYVPGVLTLYNGHDVRGNMVDAGGARFYEYSVLNQATSIWRDNINNPSIRSRFAYGSDGQRYRRIDDGSTLGATTTTTYIGNVERRQLPGGSIQWRRSVGGVVLIEHYGDSVSGGITQASGSGTIRHQFNDHLGSVQAIGSVSGSSITVLERLDTDAHGEWRTPSPPFGQAGSSHTSRGFTGHEHLNGLDTLHMNGRLYWASGGRMVQPDPIITDPLNPQNWNPYSYVMNNPLNLIDPSGYSFLSKYWRTIVAVVVTVYTGGMAASATSGWAAAGWAAGGGFVAGAIQTDSLRGGVYGAFSGLVFNGIGRAYGNMAQANAAAGTRTLGSTGLTAGQFTGMIIANGAAGGVMSSLQGGKFGHGFASAGFTTAASPAIGNIKAPIAQGAATALVGGTASVMTGGKFANGAVTAAFSYAFSSAVRRGVDDQGRPLSENEIAAAKEAYGDQIKDYESVRFHGKKWMLFQGREVAMAPDGSIYWPAAKGCADLTACTLTTSDGYQYQTLPTFIHEMGHVMQYQQGINVVLRALPHQLLHIATFGKYDPYLSRQQFYQTPTPLRLNVEAQADWYMHSFCTRAGGC